MQTKVEVMHGELQRYVAELREFIEAVCSSSAFRTSPRSCEFLRHIAENALNGNINALKERFIGMTLLGRDASYDTGADASVRVRANDVRKRLSAYAKLEHADNKFQSRFRPAPMFPASFESPAV